MPNRAASVSGHEDSIGGHEDGTAVAESEQIRVAAPPVRRLMIARVVAQLQTFLQRARSDRFFALWVLEATLGIRRCELAGARRDLLDLYAGTLATETTRVVVDGRVIESDGKTENAQHVLALDPFTLAALKMHIEKLDQERPSSGRTTTIMACCSAGRTAGLRTLTRSRGGSSSWPRRLAPGDRPARRAAQLRHRRAGREDRLEGAQQAHRARGRGVHHEAVRPNDLEADRQVANTLAELIIGDLLISIEIADETGCASEGAA